MAEEKPYAEKLLVVRENQETPFHFHKVKMEDIIVRGGGNLMIELHNAQDGGGLAATYVSLMVDGVEHRLDAGKPISLMPGQSATITRNLWHRFYGEAGKGTVFVGEVSQVNDDLTDNVFAEPIGRFATVDEDVAHYDGTTAVVRSAHVAAEDIEFLRWRAERWMKVKHLPAAFAHSPLFVLSNGGRMLAHTFAGTTLRSAFTVSERLKGRKLKLSRPLVPSDS